MWLEGIWNFELKTTHHHVAVSAMGHLITTWWAFLPTTIWFKYGEDMKDQGNLMRIPPPQKYGFKYGEDMQD
jgi:hypothetical protein